ncbi:hypothetical protein [Aquimarina algicola]|uniref:Uncharacterized protein n=1 Tax=Aquimarina algicola TaxID=2589995 RepID=A0A504JDH7_9FLAO|nr:hypothetical protein [Aquimarina algicola]TPN89086.1 hypothetical protein FHK87_02370 [Aquimarina algicola]
MYNFKQPFYTIYVYELSAGEIWVNDVPLLRWMGPQTKDGMYNGAIPINNAVLQNGTHELTCKLKPRYDYKTFNKSESQDIYDIGFDCREVSDLRTKIQIAPNIENPYGKWNEQEQRFINETLKDLPEYITKTKFEVTELPFVLDGWQNSVDVSKIKEEELFKEVLSSYYQIHAIMNSHNAAKFLELSKEKMKLQEQAFYFSEDQKKGFLNEVTKLFDQKLEIMPLDPTKLRLDIMGYGKLVRLVRLDGSAALQFKSPDPKNQGNIEFDTKLHMKTENQGLSII